MFWLNKLKLKKRCRRTSRRLLHEIICMKNKLVLLFLRIKRKQMPFYIYKVEAIDKDSNETKLLDKYFFECRDIYKYIPFKNYYINYTFQSKDFKRYNYIEHKDDESFIKPIVQKKVFFKKYVSIRLNDNDVTQIFFRYIGTNQDFFGKKITLSHMFTKDELKTNNELSLVTNFGTYEKFTFGPNDILNI